MIEHKPFIITIVGPESSGKTTLARQLADHFGCPWVPEYAREYLEGLGRPYEERDLAIMAERQLAAILTGISHQSTVGALHSGVYKFLAEAGQNGFLTFPREVNTEMNRPVLIVDGGMMSFRMWAGIKYGMKIPVVEDALRSDLTSVYVLCRPVFPWEADPLREAPALLDRVWIYNRYLMELVATPLK